MSRFHLQLSRQPLHCENMIQSFRRKGLRDLFLSGASTGVRPDLQKQVRRILDALNEARTLKDLAFPGFRLHFLRGTLKRTRFRSMARGASLSSGTKAMPGV